MPNKKYILRETAGSEFSYPPDLGLYSPILDKNKKPLRVHYLANQDRFGVGQIRILRSEHMVMVRNLIDGIDYWSKADALSMIPEDEAIIMMLKQKYER